TEQLFSQVREPDPAAAIRLFVPTRPTVLFAGDRARVHAVLPGRGEAVTVTLFTRESESGAWTPSPMNLAGRRTFAADIEHRNSAGPLMDYYVEARCNVAGSSKVLTAPLEAPTRCYTVTLV
ncbi:MAG: hypothetical protein ACRD2O_18070, partial [Terriglobia bacterium]